MQGSRIANFMLQERIGSGATSVVYRAVEDATERTVAIKLLARALAFNAYARAQLLREIEQIVALQHPQIAPILQTGMFREQVYFVLPFYAGGSLADRMDAAWTLAEARDLITQLSAPLEAAHAAGLVHGRLKPSNIFFEKSDQENVFREIQFPKHHSEMPIVADFGLGQLALANSGGWRGKAVHATPYTAPEQLLGQPLSPQTDIYALGKLVQRLMRRDDVAAEAVVENSAERPQSLPALIETLTDPPQRSWRNLFNQTKQILG